MSELDKRGCDACDGTGRIRYEGRCSKCDGSGCELTEEGEALIAFLLRQGFVRARND